MEDSSKGQSAGGKSSGLVSSLTFSTDPPYINIFDDEIFEQYSIMTSYAADGIFRGQAAENYNYSTMNRPIVWDKTYQPHKDENYQVQVSNPELVGEVVFEYLDRIITTPGDISTVDLKAAVTEYIARCTDLVAAWASTASLYGLAESFPRGSGQIKNYLS